MVEQAPPAAKRRSRTRMLVQGVVSLLLVVVIFYFLLKKIDPAQVWAAITGMTWLELTLLGLLAVWNLSTYAFVWMAVTPAPQLSLALLHCAGPGRADDASSAMDQMAEASSPNATANHRFAGSSAASS